MNKRTRSIKSEKWRHTCNSVEIAWTNEQKVAVTSYGRNKNHDDEIKKHSRTSPDVQFKEFSLNKKKLDLKLSMNGLEKPFRKKSGPKNRKNSKNQSEIAACEQKTTTDKANFCSNTVFSLYFKISRRKTTRFFVPFPVSAWPKSLLQFDFKNHKNVWTDLKKKDSAPIQFKFFEL